MIFISPVTPQEQDNKKHYILSCKKPGRSKKYNNCIRNCVCVLTTNKLLIIPTPLYNYYKQFPFQIKIYWYIFVENQIKT